MSASCLRMNDTTVMIFSFFWIENRFSHYRSQLCDLYLLARVTEPAPTTSGNVSSFLEPVGHSLRISADLNRRHKPVAEPFLFCLTLFPSFVKTKAFSEEQEAGQLPNSKPSFSRICCGALVMKVEILSFKLLITLKLSEIHKSLLIL